ncbi:MAG TPA: hypothetical protein VK858_13015 [Longimicrobiales bacterium]|nr:hypothetical protein [Longimicrobiales bacterium]
MRWWNVGIVVGALGLAACDSGTTIVVPGGGGPAAPVGLDVRYYDRSVVVTWELSSAWNGEPFRVYAAPPGLEWVMVAEVTNCSAGLCSYTDVNIEAGATYDYYVAAVGFDGSESATTEAIRITIPAYTPPPVPGGMEVVALDGANYLRWDDRARDASDFSFYRVYLYLDGESFLLGETDSEGFLDELAENGLTYEYFVTALDEYGHESDGGGSAWGTPRPDFHGEYLYDYFAVPALSGFIFQEDESFDPVVPGTDLSRHFRFETDASGWWLVPGPGVTVYPQGFETSALKCGPGADAYCVALDEAPSSGYVSADLGLQTQTTYVLRVPGADNQLRYAALRVQVLGFDQNDDPLMIFDWSYQLQPGNPALSPVGTTSLRVR